jgi:multisubunit Na+/H+ antiporter MnhB subunit
VQRILIWGFTVVLLAALGFLLLYLPPAVWSGTVPESVASLSRRMQEHLFLRAVEESGAINLVSAIYLGYRAFDTLGETLVLVLSVAGVVLVTGGKR